MVQNNVESSGLSYDPRAAIRHLGEADATLRDLMVEIGGFDLELRSEQTPFEALLRSIVYQQLSGHAAGSILNRILAMYGDVYPEPQQLLNTSEDELRACGLSRSKIRAARDLAKRTANGLLPNSTDIASMDDDQIVDAFVTVFGIGPWTVEMLLIFHLGRPDVLPVNDLGVRRGFMVSYGTEALPEPAALKEYGERWRPYRSVASLYLWRAADLQFRADA